MSINKYYILIKSYISHNGMANLRCKQQGKAKWQYRCSKNSFNNVAEEISQIV